MTKQSSAHWVPTWYWVQDFSHLQQLSPQPHSMLSAEWWSYYGGSFSFWCGKFSSLKIYSMVPIAPSFQVYVAKPELMTLNDVSLFMTYLSTCWWINDSSLSTISNLIWSPTFLLFLTSTYFFLLEVPVYFSSLTPAQSILFFLSYIGNYMLPKNAVHFALLCQCITNISKTCFPTISLFLIFFGIIIIVLLNEFSQVARFSSTFFISFSYTVFDTISSIICWCKTSVTIGSSDKSLSMILSCNF